MEVQDLTLAIHRVKARTAGSVSLVKNHEALSAMASAR